MTEVGMQIDEDEISNAGDESTRKKRPPNAYMLFCQDNREQVLERDPSLNYKTVMTRLGEIWTTLPAEEKQPYNDRAKEAQAKFKQENPSYKYKPRKHKVSSHSSNQLILPNGISSEEATYLMVLGAQTLIFNQKQNQATNLQGNNLLSQIQPSAAAAPTTSAAAAVAAVVANVIPGLAPSSDKQRKQVLQQNMVPSMNGLNNQPISMNPQNQNQSGLGGLPKADEMNLFQTANDLPFQLSSLPLGDKMTHANVLNAVMQLQASAPPNQGSVQIPQQNKM